MTLEEFKKSYTTKELLSILEANKPSNVDKYVCEQLTLPNEEKEFLIGLHDTNSKTTYYIVSYTTTKKDWAFLDMGTSRSQLVVEYYFSFEVGATLNRIIEDDREMRKQFREQAETVAFHKLLDNYATEETKSRIEELVYKGGACYSYKDDNDKLNFSFGWIKDATSVENDEYKDNFVFNVLYLNKIFGDEIGSFMAFLLLKGVKA